VSRIEDLQAFIAIVEQGSLTAAARALGRSLQAVSRSLIAIEQSVGVELIRRTTRRSSPTDAGAAFYRRVQPAVAEIVDARHDVSNQKAEPSGRLLVSAPVLFAPPYVIPAIADFMKRYPQVEVELTLSDQFVNLGDSGIDLAVRIGNLPDSDLKAKRLGSLRRVVFGAPEYFAKHGRPAHPSELTDHQCVTRTIDGSPAKWPFRIAGKRRLVSVSGRFRTDSTTALYAAVAQGLGISFTPLWQIRDLVQRGVVEVILSNYEEPPIPIQAVWPGSKLIPAKTRLFLDVLVSKLKKERLE